MSSELSSNKDHWQKTADRYLGVARASAASTSAVAFLWMIAIIISVLSFVDEADKGKTAIIKAQEAYLQASNDFDNAICDLSRLKSDKEFKCQSNSSEINELKKGYKSSYKSNKFDKTKCESEKKKEKKERDVELIILCVYEQVKATEEELRSAQSSTTELKLPTFPSFKIKLVYVPTLLNLIVLSLAIYLSLMRVRTFTYLSRTLHIMKKHIDKSKEEISDILSPRNWWMAPLPRKSRTLVSDEEFALALGWSHSSQAKPILALSFWFLILFIQFYLTFIISIPKDFLLDDTNKIPINFISFLNVFPLGITFSIFLWWFVPSIVPDGNFDPDNEIWKERRRFLTHLCTGAILSAVINNFPKGFLFINRRFVNKNPRFRKKDPRAFFGSYQLNGFFLFPFPTPPLRVLRAYIAQKSYLTGMRKSQLPKEFKPGLLEKLEPSELIHDSSIYINRSIVSVSYELAAKELFDKNSWSKTAFKVLMMGIEQDLEYKQHAKLFRGFNDTREKPRKRKQNLPKNAPRQVNWNGEPTVSVRLYDLFAKEAVRNKQPELIKQQLIPFINANKLAPIFEHRITKWTNPQSKWYRDLMKYGLRSSNVG